MARPRGKWKHAWVVQWWTGPEFHQRKHEEEREAWQYYHRLNQIPEANCDVRFGELYFIDPYRQEEVEQMSYTVGSQPPASAYDYLGWHEWAKTQYDAGLRQVQCPVCELYQFPQEPCIKNGICKNKEGKR